ncbi:hypothetical protein ATANTOWER_005044 [Ataeniobius toweri]|uniref:Uncharacterized protein n=1 Tax=Ataeniobius toweri TaxID=208326 RepID=A0ABU7AWL1_9TELE|nr:hypothetical protein [Ataeniobius toweri]
MVRLTGSTGLIICYKTRKAEITVRNAASVECTKTTDQVESQLLNGIYWKKNIIKAQTMNWKKLQHRHPFR